MKYSIHLIITLFFILILDQAGLAQIRRGFNPLEEDITDRVPPLSVLMDSAFHHDPAVKFTELQQVINRCNLRTSRAQWAQDIGIQGNVGYGTFDYLYNNNVGGQNQATTTLKQNETQYGIGGFLRLPLFDVVNHRNQSKLAKAEIAQAETLTETRRNEIRELVIRQYNDMIAKQRVLKIKSKYLETSKINTQMAEKGFTNGAVTVDEYSRVSEISSRTETEFETAKMDFITSYMVLEVITGIDFKFNNE